MAVVKSPKNNKNKTLWIQRHNKKFIKTVNFSKKDYNHSRSSTVGWRNVYRKTTLKFTNKVLYSV